MECTKLALMVLIGTTFVVSEESHAEIMWSGSEVRSTAVSGYPGAINQLGFGYENKQGISAVTWGERNNVPCQIVISARNLDGTSNVPAGSKAQNRCTTTSASKTVEFAENPRFFVRGIATCGSKVNRNEKRIKGIKIVAAKVWQTKHQVDALATSDAESNPNCYEPWHDTVYCDDGWVASGLDVHRDGDAIVGLALRCRQVGWGSGATRPE